MTATAREQRLRRLQRRFDTLHRRMDQGAWRRRQVRRLARWAPLLLLASFGALAVELASPASLPQTIGDAVTAAAAWTAGLISTPPG
ncbi:MAG: hypothetical protein ACK4RV_18860 [Caulobacter sp.]